MAVENALYEMSQNIREVGSEDRGPRVDVYARNARSGLSLREGVAGREWCGMFIWWCYSQAARFLGQTLPFIDIDLWSGQRVVHWSRSHPDAVVLAGDVLPGDIYVAPSFHIGMALTATSDPTLFKSIDGNQSTADSGNSAVTQNIRHVNNCRLIVRI